MRRLDDNKNSVVQALLMVSQFSINMLVPIGMMCALGIWLDKTLGTDWWTVILFFVGALAGGQNICRMAGRIWGKESQKKEQKDSHEDIGTFQK